MLNLLHIFLNYERVFANLSFNYIEEKVNSMYTGEKENLKETIANPIFGLLADGIGMNYNLRFFNYNLDRNFENGNFIKDKSKDLFSSAIIKLFPSPWGDLSIFSEKQENSLSIFNLNKNESVRFFAQLFISILKKETNFQYKSSVTESKQKILFDEIAKMLLNEEKTGIFSDKSIKLLLIHSYVLTALGPVDSEDLLTIYLQEIFNSIDSNENYPILNDIRVDLRILEKIRDYDQNLNFFPYSQFNQPTTNKLFSTDSELYTKMENNQICADLSLLHICNCLFNDNGTFNLKHIPKASEELKKFYSKHSKIFPVTDEVINDWSKVIHTSPTIKSEETFSTKNIGVINGIVNTMNVLVRITGTPREAIFIENFEENLEQVFKNLIELISLKEEDEPVANIKITEKFEKFKNEEKKDFIGAYTIDFNYINDNEATIEVKHSKDHISVNLLSSGNISNNIEIFDESLIHDLKRNEIIFRILKCYLLPEEESELITEDSFFNRIYVSGKINNDEIKKNYLIEIWKFINDLQVKKEDFQSYEKLTEIIFESLNLKNADTVFDFEEFIFLKPDCIAGDGDKLFGGMEAATDLEIPAVDKKWHSLVSKQMPEVKNIDFSGDFEKVDLYLIDKANLFPNLESLNISNDSLNTEKLKKIINGLFAPENLKELIVSFNGELKILPSEIKKLVNLTNFEACNCALTELPDEFKTLTNLRYLQLASNSLNGDYSFCFQGFKNLEYLNLLSNNLTEFPDYIRHLTGLEKLYLSQKEILEIPEIMRPIFKNLHIFANFERTAIPAESKPGFLGMTEINGYIEENKRKLEEKTKTEKN